MKLSIKLFLSSIILLSSINVSYAQIEDHYRSFRCTMYMPIRVSHIEKMIYSDGRIVENDVPTKEMTISLNIRAEDMHVSNDYFSGVLNTSDLVSDDAIVYKGKITRDKQMIEYIEISKDYTLYTLETRTDIEKTTYIMVRFENIPLNNGSYKYKFGISKIASVAYKEDYSIDRGGYVDTYHEIFLQIDRANIAEYYSGINVSFKPGNQK